MDTRHPGQLTDHERHEPVGRLTAEHAHLEAATLREVTRLCARIIELEGQRARLEAELLRARTVESQLQATLAALQSTLGWMVLERIRRFRVRLAPAEARRDRWLRAAVRLAKVGLRDGIGAAAGLVRHRTARRPRGARPGGSPPPPRAAIVAAAPASTPDVVAEHPLAHALLDGLVGLEIGPAAYNPFGLRTRHVAPREDYEFYAGEQRKRGVEPAPIDIWAEADALPIEDQSEDFVLSSHVVEHLPDVIAAFREWDRVVRDGGYVFMLVPLKGALAEDADRPLTPLAHFIDDYRAAITLDSHPTDGVPGGRRGHYHTFTPDSILAIVDWMREHRLCRWSVVAREDVDSKVGNGFTLAFRVLHPPDHERAEAARQAPDGPERPDSPVHAAP